GARGRAADLADAALPLRDLTHVRAEPFARDDARDARANLHRAAGARRGRDPDARRARRGSRHAGPACARRPDDGSDPDDPAAATAVVAPASQPPRWGPPLGPRSADRNRARRGVRAARPVSRTGRYGGDHSSLGAGRRGRPRHDRAPGPGPAARRPRSRASVIGCRPGRPRARERPPISTAAALRGDDAAITAAAWVSED